MQSSETKRTTASPPPQPPGTKSTPLQRTCRMVDPRTNPSLIVGIPKIIKEMAQIQSGDSFSVYLEKNPNGKYRVIYEKEDPS